MTVTLHGARRNSLGAVTALVAAGLWIFGLVGCAARPAPLPTTEAQAEEASKRALSRARALARAPGATGEDLALAGWIIWMHEGDAEAAMELFERALDVEPTTAPARLGLARLARSRLDDESAAAHLLGMLTDTPRDPLSEIAVDLLQWSVASDPDIDLHAISVLREIEESEEAEVGLRVAARHLLSRMLERMGDDEGYVSLASAGAPGEWTVMGPFSRFSSLEPGDHAGVLASGRIEESYEGPIGEIVPWIERAPEGTLAPLGAPDAGDVYYAAVDLLVPERGDYHLFWRSRSQVRVVLSGVEVLLRDPIEETPPSRGSVPLHLEPGIHRLVVRFLSGLGGGAIDLSILDESGRDSDMTFMPAVGPAPLSWRPEEEEEKREGRWRWQRGRDSERSEAVVPGEATTLYEEIEKRVAADPSGLLGAYIVAAHRLSYDRESAKPLIEILTAAAPRFAPAYYLAALSAYGDPALPGDLRMGRASAAAKTAAKLDPRHGWSRLMAATIAVEQSRYDEAAKLLDEAVLMAPLAPDLVLERAGYLSARGQPVLAREAIETGLAALPGHCRLLRAAHGVRQRDLDLEGTDETASLLEDCGASARLLRIEHLAERGDIEAAIDGLVATVRARPTRLGERSRLVDLLIAAGRLDDARAELIEMKSIWRGMPSLVLRLADIAAREGDDARALELRRRYLRLAPSALHVRRALAFQEGEELLDWAALDLEAAIEEYQADDDREAYGTDAVLVVDHAGVEVFAEDPARPAVVERIQMVTEVLTKQGLDRHGEVSVPQGAKIVALHTRKADGRIFEPEVTPQKDTITLAGLEVGDFVVVDYLLGAPARSAAMPGWSASPFYLQVYGTPLHDVTYVARAPVAVGLEVEARNVDVEEPAEEDGFLVFRYEASRVPAVLSEHDSTGAAEVLPWVRVGAGSSPLAYGDAWGDYVAGGAKADHEVRRFTAKVLAGLSSEVRDDPRALTHALAEAVNAEVLGRAPSTRLGEVASHALARGRGNRLLVTRAVLAAVGIDTRIALVRPFDSDPVERRFPAGDLYRYAVLRADPGDGGPYVWIDQNVRTAPIGTLRPLHAGRPAILLAEPGRPTELTTTPEVPRTQESRRSVLHLEIDRLGNLVARGIDTYTGFWGATVRSGMEQADEDRRRQAVEASLSQAFGPIRLRELSFEGADDDARPGQPMVVRYEFSVEGWARTRGDVIEAPGGALFPALISRRLVRLSERRLPLLLQTETIRQLEATFDLPEGYTLAKEPEAIELSSPVGRFERTVETEDELVVVREHLELALVRVQPDEYDELVRLAAAVDRAQAAGLPFEKRVAE